MGRTQASRPNGHRKRHGVLKANGTKIVGTGILDGPLQTVRIAENFVKWTVEDAGPYNNEKRLSRTPVGATIGRPFKRLPQTVFGAGKRAISVNQGSPFGGAPR